MLVSIELNAHSVRSEIIHTASLFHDDVIDKASTRRGVESVNRAFGNKMAILGGIAIHLKILYVGQKLC